MFAQLIPTPDDVVEWLIAATLGPSSVVLVLFLTARALSDWAFVLREGRRAGAVAVERGSTLLQDVAASPAWLPLALLALCISIGAQALALGWTYVYGHYLASGFSNDGRIEEVRSRIEVEGFYEALANGAVTDVLSFGWVSGVLLAFGLFGSYSAYREGGREGGTIFALPSFLAALLLVLPLLVLAVGTLLWLLGMALSGFEYIPIREAAASFTDRELRNMATYIALTASHLMLAYCSSLAAESAARLWRKRLW